MPFQTPVFREELSTLQGNDALKPIELLFEPRQTLNNGWRERRIQSLAYNFGDKKKSKNISLSENAWLKHQDEMLSSSKGRWDPCRAREKGKNKTNGGKRRHLLFNGCLRFFSKYTYHHCSTS